MKKAVKNEAFKTASQVQYALSQEIIKKKDLNIPEHWKSYR